MFRKIHLRLTLLCAGITAFIMIVMSLSYLLVSESGLRKNQFLSFQSDMNTLLTNLEQQTIISFEWLNKMESQGKYTIFVLDNGVPFLFNELGNTSSGISRQQLLEKGMDFYNSHFEVIPTAFSLSSYQSHHEEFEFTINPDNQKYYGCMAFFERHNSVLQIAIFSSQKALDSQITEQRIRFIFIDLVSIIALSLFSWFFTRKLLKPIDQSRKGQNAFISAASHELRTPLAVILSSASACRKAPESDKDQFLQTIASESLRMSGLIDDMLTLTRSDSHNWQMQMAPAEPDTILLTVYENFEPMAAEHHLHLLVELPETALVSFSCDRSRIEQLLSILLHNAISYTPAGGQIKLQLQYAKKKVIFIVADNGPGITDAEKENIFRRFYRTDQSRSSKNHFGLGLSIAAEIVQAHKGSIKVIDTPGGGATFVVSFSVE